MSMKSSSRKELSDDPALLFRTAFQGELVNVWTALPGIVVSFDPAKMTCKVQPAIQAERTKADGTKEWVNLPVLVDCPVTFPSAGGFTLTFPIAPDDECLVVFASRCIDAWWASGGVGRQLEYRLHDLSDGFVVMGPRSQPRVVPNISTTAVELRNDAGTAHVAIAKNGGINIKTPGKLTAQAGISATVIAPSIVLEGDVTVNGTITAAGLISAPNFETPIHDFNTHLHTNVRFGTDRTGPPFPG